MCVPKSDLHKNLKKTDKFMDFYGFHSGKYLVCGLRGFAPLCRLLPTFRSNLLRTFLRYELPKSDAQGHYHKSITIRKQRLVITLRDHNFKFISQSNSSFCHVTQQEYECISQGRTMSQVGLSRALRCRSRVRFEARPMYDLWPTK